ncbi:hypothetical protein OUZ56_023079 [Daphnia magna]|uniref:Uncharacterized protein n=1 Tax=Daphnia magna TaxID=35525 RepID=A0ABR0AZ01_9CRUS|nr:hypothetical protein OUZ56_023079 [Daphnia magna]
MVGWWDQCQQLPAWAAWVVDLVMAETEMSFMLQPKQLELVSVSLSSSIPSVFGLKRFHQERNLGHVIYELQRDPSYWKPSQLDGTERGSYSYIRRLDQLARIIGSLKLHESGLSVYLIKQTARSHPEPADDLTGSGPLLTN